MFKGHPKGLIIAFFANMGERFGFYTMMAILVLFLQTKFGLDEQNAGYIYGTFYFLIYFLALAGGLLADNKLGLNKTITAGIVLMTIGYCIMAVPGLTLTITCAGLFVIAFGNGLFKGNLQAVVGNLYEPQQYQHLRDRAFSIFYMGINVGAIFAPTAATSIRNWFLSTQGFNYDSTLPKLANAVKDAAVKGDVSSAITPEFLEKATAAWNGTVVTANNAVQFANEYINAFSYGYNCAFAIAAGAMILSLLVYTFFKKGLLPGMSPVVEQAAPKAATATKINIPTNIPTEAKATDKERITALILVFLVVIFFWMSFHQNGLTMTFYARDYTRLIDINKLTYMLFDVWFLLPVAVAIGGLYFGILNFVKKNSSAIKGLAGLVVAAALGYVAYLRFGTYVDNNSISAEIFQQFNPIFVVLLTPLIVGFFGFLSKRNIEPSAPRKIGIGMIIASIGFAVLMLCSVGQELPTGLGGKPNLDFSSPYVLISVYLILTIAELFLSPMGISFVSKVAPPKYKGLMQGGWLCATAIGNQLLIVGSIMWGVLTEVWQLWAIFVVCTCISALVIFTLMKRLERVTRNS